MQMMARGWIAFELTHEHGSVGIVMMSWGIPQLLLSLIGGAIDAMSGDDDSVADGALYGAITANVLKVVVPVVASPATGTSASTSCPWHPGKVLVSSVSRSGPMGWA